MVASPGQHAGHGVSQLRRYDPDAGSHEMEGSVRQMVCLGAGRLVQCDGFQLRPLA